MEEPLTEFTETLGGDLINDNESVGVLNNNEEENLLNTNVDTENNNEDVETLAQDELNEDEVSENEYLLETSGVVYTDTSDVKSKLCSNLDEHDNLHGLAMQYDSLNLSEAKLTEECFDETPDEIDSTDNNVSINDEIYKENEIPDILVELVEHYSPVKTVQPVELTSLPTIIPFNNIDQPEDSLWQMQQTVAKNPDYVQDSEPPPQHELPAKESSDIWAKQEVNEHDDHPMFELMPNVPVKRISYDCDSCAGVDDIEAAVQQAKIESNQEPVADDPWVKMAPPKTTSISAPSTPVQPTKSIESTVPRSESAHHIKEDAPTPTQTPHNPVLNVPGPCEAEDLIDGIIFTANYLGSTQLHSEKNPGKTARMLQAQEAVNRIKAPEGESQPSVEVDLFVSIDRVKVLNADTQETMMDHTLRSISYIADIGTLLVVMARRRLPKSDSEEPKLMREPKPHRAYKVICHVFTSGDARIMAQAIGQAFSVAYQQFLTSNGIEPQTLTPAAFNELLDMQEMYHDDLVHYSRRENVKDVWIEKTKGEALGVVVVESGWGSIVPTVILANLQHGGPAERSGKLSIGDQIMSVNSTSLVGLPLTTCQSIIKGLKGQSLARLNIVSCPPVVTVLIKRPDLKYQLGFSVQDGIICSLMRGGIAERGGVRVGHRIIEINGMSVVAIPHERIVHMLVSSVGEIQMKTMPAMMYRLLTGQEHPVYI